MISRILFLNKNSLATSSLARRFSSEAFELPVVDLSSFIGDKKPDMKEAKKIVDGLHKYGALAIRDPRVKEEGNQQLLDMMENYFKSRGEMYYKGERLKEAFPEYGYQVGVTPENKEIAK